MSYFNFDVPPTMQALLDLLRASNQWNLSLTEGQSDIKVIDLNNDTVIFTAGTMEETHDFLNGCFLITFWGESLQNIINDVGRLKGERYWRWCVRTGRW